MGGVVEETGDEERDGTTETNDRGAQSQVDRSNARDSTVHSVENTSA